MKTNRLFAAAIAVFATFALSARLPAATPPASSPATVSLAGEWRFKLDRDNAGNNEKWYDKDLDDKIKLPGILQAQGFGDDISTDTPWVLTLGADWWKLQPKDLVDHFSQPGKVEVPFLSQPAKHYLGLAWYQRDIDIPADWAGKRVVLYLERAHWESTVFVDDKPYAPNDSLVAPHVTDLGMLTPGKHRLTIRVDNTTKMQASNHLVDAHSISDQLGATWNGIVGRIELQATSPVYIDNAQAYPDLLKKLVHFRVKIGNASGQAGNGTVRVDFETQHMVMPDGLQADNPQGGNSTANVAWNATGGTAEFDVPLTYPGIPWSEYTPALQHMKISINGTNADDSQEIAFGLRQISFSGKDLLLNGKLVNLRMTHFGGDFPITGYPAMDVDSWKRIIQICKSYGLNGMRFHSWCPPEAAFEAADELGFYLAPECGMWNNFSTPGMTQRLYEESARILIAYGNHPSFMLLSPSNEPSGSYTTVTPEWAAAEYQADPRRLYAAATGWSASQQVADGAQYASMPAYGRGSLRGSGGWFGKDYAAALAGIDIPVLAHEVGQYCAYPDFDVINEYTGYLRPSNYDIFKYIAEQQGLLVWDKVFAWASGRFQLACYKEEIEANLRTPGLSGFQLLDLHDYIGQGTALIGVLDTFWNSKGYVTGKEFSQFSGPVVPLVRLAQRVFTTADTLNASAEIYNYGDGPLPRSTAYWKIVNDKGVTVDSGEFNKLDIPIGKNIALGNISSNLAALPAPAAYSLVVGVNNTQYSNAWNFWVYPANISDTVPDNITVTDSWADARTALAAGKRVLFSPKAANTQTGQQSDLVTTASDPFYSPLMASSPIFWNIQMTVRPPNNPTAKADGMLGLYVNSSHPALAKFPTNLYCDFQWTPMINNVRAVNLDKLPKTFYPIVSCIDDWNRDFRLGVIFETYVGDGGDSDGRLLVSAINVVNPRTVGARQLRRSLLDYMANDDGFDPKNQLTLQQAGDLWVNGNPAASGDGASPAASAPATTPARAFDPDLNDASVPVVPTTTSAPAPSPAPAN